MYLQHTNTQNTILKKSNLTWPDLTNLNLLFVGAFVWVSCLYLNKAKIDSKSGLYNLQQNETSLNGYFEKLQYAKKYELCVAFGIQPNTGNFICCFFGVMFSAKDLAHYLYPELKLFTVKTFQQIQNN